MCLRLHLCRHSVLQQAVAVAVAVGKRGGKSLREQRFTLCCVEPSPAAEWIIQPSEKSPIGKWLADTLCENNPSPATQRNIE